MRLTQYSDFALRVLIYLATIPNNDELVRIDDIAKSYGISKKSFDQGYSSVEQA